MIITRLIGGLGNQMFQYAAGRCLAEKNNTVLKFDVTDFPFDKLREYELGVFNIKEEFATEKEIEALSPKIFSKFKRGMNKVLLKKPDIPASYIKEKHFHFDPEILLLSRDVYLDGYWQTEKYFSDIKEIIRNEFTIKNPLEGQNKELFDTISSVNSVSIHIRRGDYVSDPVVNESHGLCGIEYYEKAVQYIAKQVENPHFFIFSDEYEWVKDNLKLDYPYKIPQDNINKGYEDLRLMKACKHNIIANSSFSWWASWLNDSSNKIVIAPEKRFNKPGRNIKDLYPEGWIIL